MSNPLLDQCLACARDGLHPSVVGVRRLDDGRWYAYIDCSDQVPLGEGPDLARHRIRVDRRDLPDGVTVTGRERYGQVPVDLPEDVSPAQIETWVREVALVGSAPDWAWIGNACLTKPVRWLPEPLRTALAERYGMTMDEEA